MRLAILSGLALLILTGPVSAQPVDVPPTWGGDIWSRPRLTGSWFGPRDELGKKGVVFDVDALLSPQGVASGGRDTEAKFWGNTEYTLNVDTQKLGLWPGGFLKGYAISGFGDTVSRASGAVAPVNIATLLPDFGNEQTGLMNLTYMQFLSTWFGVIVGKLNGLGADDNEFAHDFHTQFLNTSLNFNMTA